MNIPIEWQEQSDLELWTAVLNDNSAAFEAVVERHKGAVSAVAYCLVPDLTLCQDISQETFWTAWRSRHQLHDRTKLAAWLCGISRNLARQASQRRRGESNLQDITQWDVASNETDPTIALVTREQNELVWKSLESIPETYREAIAIYYRQGESIAAIASSLEISMDAAKQRLSRGRELLKEHLSDLVQDVLQRSKPSSFFTTRVMVGVAAWTAALKAGSVSAAGLGGAAVGKTTAGILGSSTSHSTLATLGTTGVAGGLLGGALGLGGAWFGSWFAAQMASNMAERSITERYGKKMLFQAVVFTVALLLASFLFLLPNGTILYFVSRGGLMLWFFSSTALSALSMQRELRSLKQIPEDQLIPNNTPLKNRMAGYRFAGRRFTSKVKLFGWPLIDVQFADIEFNSIRGDKNPKHCARGWIAIGDSAIGLLVAIGGVAKGLIAVGGIAMGGIAFGGLAVGLVSLGGGAIGVLAIGGGAIGYDAIGGAAIGWNSATGGGAIAKHAAVGGFAMASDYAVGGGAFAKNTNTPEAMEYVKQVTYEWIIKWYTEHQAVGTMLLVLPAIVFSMLSSLCYRKEAFTADP